MRYNLCLETVEHCDACDNLYNPSRCAACKENRYPDPTTNSCKSNVCNCSHGRLGECLIHNRHDCASCYRGYVLTVVGENRMCEACGLNEEPNASRSGCIPCSKNFQKAAGQSGYCDNCPDNTVRNGEDSCIPCDEHHFRTDIYGDCEPCPTNAPRRFENEDRCTMPSCPEGQYSNSETDYACRNCGYNQEPNASQTGCIACQRGFSSQPGETCSLRINCAAKLVRQAISGNRMHPAYDWLSGTSVYGVAGYDTFSIPYENEVFDTMIFKTVNSRYFMAMTKAEVGGPGFGGGEYCCETDASIRNFYKLEPGETEWTSSSASMWNNIAGHTWLSLRDHSNSLAAEQIGVLYGEIAGNFDDHLYTQNAPWANKLTYARRNEGGLQVYLLTSGSHDSCIKDGHIGRFEDGVYKLNLEVCSGKPTERIVFSENQAWFAKEISSGVMDINSRYNGRPGVQSNGNYQGMDKIIDGDRSTYVHSVSGCGDRQCNLFISLSRRFNITRVDVIARQDETEYTYDRYQNIEMRCLKGDQTYTLCNAEAFYDRSQVIARNGVLRFQCNDECVGIEAYQGSIVSTHYAGIEIYGCDNVIKINTQSNGDKMTATALSSRDYNRQAVEFKVKDSNDAYVQLRTPSGEGFELNLGSTSALRYVPDTTTRTGIKDLDVVTNHRSNGNGTTNYKISWACDDLVVEREVTTLSSKVPLTNPRFALYDASLPEHHTLVPIGWWPTHPPSNAIDGNQGRDGTDHASHPPEGQPDAHFFVDLMEPTTVDYVFIWPRTLPSAHSTDYYSIIENQYYTVKYRGMNVYAGSVLCTAEHDYTKLYVESNLLPNGEPMVYNCPLGTIASTIRVSPDSYQWAYVQLAEIEVFTNTGLVLNYLINLFVKLTKYLNFDVYNTIGNNNKKIIHL